jgi:hypothetical protein
MDPHRVPVRSLAKQGPLFPYLQDAASEEHKPSSSHEKRKTSETTAISDVASHKQDFDEIAA